MLVAPVPWDEKETYEVSGRTYTVHPFARLFPLIEGEAFTRFVEDVGAHGVREPILVAGPDASVIVDGRNRLRAAIEARTTPVFKELPADADPFAVIISANIRRRNMRKGQYAMIGALLLRAAIWQDLRKDQVAARLSVADSYLRRAERVLRVAPDLAAQVLQGSLELNAAAETCKEPAPPGRDVPQAAPAAGETSTDRTDDDSQSSAPSGKRTTTPTESTSRGENPQGGKARSTRKENASDAMSAPAGEVSSQPASTATATESARGAEAPGRSPELTTPPLLLSCLRVTLGDIDLDPCSSDTAKDSVAAGEWYSPEQDGLSLPWQGTVHVFPPLERVGEFADKLLAELASGRVRRASFLGPADLRSDWAVKLLESPGFDGVVVERGRRSASAAGDGAQDMGRLALFLLGLGSSPSSKVFGVWGVPLTSTLRE